jgi:hypothetical protein
MRYRFGDEELEVVGCVVQMALTFWPQRHGGLRSETPVWCGATISAKTWRA